MSEVAEKPSGAPIKTAGYRQPPEHTKWKPGFSPNPGGKPKNARNILTAKFFHALADDFSKHGVDAIKAARIEDPMGYVKTVASLMPKEFQITKPLEEISDEQLDAAIITIRAILAAQSNGDGEGGSGQAQPVKVLQTLPEAV